MGLFNTSSPAGRSEYLTKEELLSTPLLEQSLIDTQFVEKSTRVIPLKYHYEQDKLPAYISGLTKAFLNNGQTDHVIFGNAGYGKTHLALNFAARMEKEKNIGSRFYFFDKRQFRWRQKRFGNKQHSVVFIDDFNYTIQFGKWNDSEDNEFSAKNSAVELINMYNSAREDGNSVVVLSNDELAYLDYLIDDAPTSKKFIETFKWMATTTEGLENTDEHGYLFEDRSTLLDKTSHTRLPVLKPTLDMWLAFEQGFGLKAIPPFIPLPEKRGAERLFFDYLKYQYELQAKTNAQNDLELSIFNNGINKKSSQLYVPVATPRELAIAKEVLGGRIEVPKLNIVHDLQLTPETASLYNVNWQNIISKIPFMSKLLGPIFNNIYFGTKTYDRYLSVKYNDHETWERRSGLIPLQFDFETSAVRLQWNPDLGTIGAKIPTTYEFKLVDLLTLDKDQSIISKQRGSLYVRHKPKYIAQYSSCADEAFAKRNYKLAYIPHIQHKIRQIYLEETQGITWYNFTHAFLSKDPKKAMLAYELAKQTS